MSTTKKVTSREVAIGDVILCREITHDHTKREVVPMTVASIVEWTVGSTKGRSYYAADGTYIHRTYGASKVTKVIA